MKVTFKVIKLVKHGIFYAVCFADSVIISYTLRLVLLLVRVLPFMLALFVVVHFFI